MAMHLPVAAAAADGSGKGSGEMSERSKLERPGGRETAAPLADPRSRGASCGAPKVWFNADSRTSPDTQKLDPRP
eukprot:3074450-Pyramimonas_sp.AAC.1